MDQEKLERLARMMEPFERTSKMTAALPDATRLADALPKINPAISNLNRIGELTAKVNLVSPSWNRVLVHSHDFLFVNQLSAINQQAVSIASSLSKSINLSNLTATTFLDSFKVSSLIVSSAVLELTERNRDFLKRLVKVSSYFRKHLLFWEIMVGI
ncbi:hypothetical protein [Dyadobacter frigoris]|uniref:Uncharacterized protein n=1 Tax=Dyadobacter frigoris TaxID=2576211 RepID=A0A4U6CKX1_9BACT|nr:hypothetical protein [Dyadobacter frigoris]TKT84889.1 hypothetical protein FDK13_34560 [Dyadobacter frigoris]